MIISDEQVQLALEYLRTPHESRDPDRSAASGRESSDLVERVRLELADLPETRSDRVAEARYTLEHEGFSPQDVAGKMIGRAISDSLR